MDITTLAGSLLMKQNQFLFDQAEFEHNQQAVDRARARWDCWIETLRAHAMRLRGLRLAQRRTNA